MKIVLKKTSPTYRQPRSTRDIMFELLIGLAVIALYSVIYQFVTHGVAYGIKAFLIYATSLVTALIVEGIWGRVHAHDLHYVMETSFPLVTPLIFALTLPVGTPLYVTAVGSAFASFLGKLVYGGFGQNIFNPALVGRVIVHLSFGAQLTTVIGSDVVSEATPASQLASIGWFINKKFHYSLMQQFLGTHGGAMGETAIWLIIVIGIILAIRRVYDPRITISYLLSVALFAGVTALIGGGNPLTYIAVHLCLGGLMFGAVFMATDPVTSPTSPIGKIIFGICLGFLSMLIRLKANYPEGVLFSILIMNMLTPFIESLTLGRTDVNIKRKIIVVIAALVISTGIISGIAYNLKHPVETAVVERSVSL